MSIPEPSRWLLQDEANHPTLSALSMIDAVSREADEQLEPQPLSLKQRGIIAELEAIAQTQLVHGFSGTARKCCNTNLPGDSGFNQLSTV